MKYTINNNDYTKEVNSLIDFAKKRMGFSNVPKILFNDDAENSSKTLGKTGYYDPNSVEIHIYSTGRHIKDILRSLSHELVHHMQNESGTLHGEETKCGHPDWSLACVNNNYMGQGYAQKNPHMREMERQAYEMGNLCFRDWEDSLKQKHPTIYNERRNRKMSLKDWKNKELSENLNKKWGFKMNLNKLTESPTPEPPDDKAGKPLQNPKGAKPTEEPTPEPPDKDEKGAKPTPEPPDKDEKGAKPTPEPPDEKEKEDLNEMAGPPSGWYDDEAGFETMADMKYADALDAEEFGDALPGEGEGEMEIPPEGEGEDEWPEEEEGPGSMDPPAPPAVGIMENKRRRKKVLKENRKIRVRIKK